MKRLFTLFIPLLMFVFSFGMNNETYAQQANEQKFSLSNGNMKLSVYPLPANSYVNIYVSPSLRLVTEKLEIINISGRKVLEQRLLDPNTNEYSFNNLTPLPAGIYFVAARDKEGKMIQSAKLVINK